MEKDVLRNCLFERYFEVQKGIKAIDFVSRLSFIYDLYHELDDLCEKNIEYFDCFDSIKSIRLVEYQSKSFLILKKQSWDYVVIDIKDKKSITEEQFKTIFDEDFFVENFGERKTEDSEVFSLFYDVEEYQGNIDDLIDFYFRNRQVFNLPTRLYYRLDLKQAWTYFSIHLAQGTAQLGFQTPDQFLYEQLFLQSDLTPSGMQDAVGKIGKERVQEMFSKIKEIKLPVQIIPEALLSYFDLSLQNKEIDLVENQKLRVKKFI